MEKHFLYSAPCREGHSTESLKKQPLPDQLINTIYKRNFDFSEGLPSKVCAMSQHFINIDNLSCTDVLSDFSGFALLKNELPDSYFY